MTDKPAVIQGCYVDCRFMPGLKSARISVDIPIEHANEFLRMFGAPDRAAPVSVAIARMTSGLGRSNENGPETASAGAPASPSAPVQGQDKPERTYTRSQVAALKVQDKTFAFWLAEQYPAVCGESDNADQALKRILRIGSKADLDGDMEAAARWDRLITSYDYRDRVK